MANILETALASNEVSTFDPDEVMALAREIPPDSEWNGDKNVIMLAESIEQKKPVFHVGEAFRAAGRDPETGLPRLAFARSNLNEVNYTFYPVVDRFHELRLGTGGWIMRFDPLPRVTVQRSVGLFGYEAFKREISLPPNGHCYSTPLPYVPPSVRPEGYRPKDLIVIWEPESWEKHYVPSIDPAICSLIGETGLAVLHSTWDLTELEASIFGIPIKELTGD